MCCACDVVTGLNDAGDTDVTTRLFSCLPAFQSESAPAIGHHMSRLLSTSYPVTGASVATNKRGCPMRFVWARRITAVVACQSGHSCFDVGQRRPAGVTGRPVTLD